MCEIKQVLRIISELEITVSFTFQGEESVKIVGGTRVATGCRLLFVSGRMASHATHEALPLAANSRIDRSAGFSFPNRYTRNAIQRSKSRGFLTRNGFVKGYTYFLRVFENGVGYLDQ
jgi:hypothetical protein